MSYTREELLRAFDHYREVAAEAGRTGNWALFVDLFADNVRYVEHMYGTFDGKQAVRDWIVPEMAKWPVKHMVSFPWDWFVIDEKCGWIVGQIANVMADPGDGKEYRAVNWTRLVYGGDGLFSEEEDVYNPQEFADMIASWVEAWKAFH